MQTETSTVPQPKAMTWAGWVLTLLPGLFLLADGIAKFFKPAPVIEATIALGYPESAILGMGIALTASVVLYLIPKTSVLGAILLTGYLGGAVASHVRMGAGWFNILFPAIFGAMIWGGLSLRDPRVRALVPFKR